MLHLNPELRSFLALLCVAVILIASWNPASSDLLCAIPTPLLRGIGFASSYSVRIPAADPNQQLAGFLTLLRSRAPPQS